MNKQVKKLAEQCGLPVSGSPIAPFAPLPFELGEKIEFILLDEMSTDFNEVMDEIYSIFNPIEVTYFVIFDDEEFGISKWWLAFDCNDDTAMAFVNTENGAVRHATRELIEDVIDVYMWNFEKLVMCSTN